MTIAIVRRAALLLGTLILAACSGGAGTSSNPDPGAISACEPFRCRG